MFSIGWAELLLLAIVGVPAFLATIVVLLAAIRYLSKPSQPLTSVAARHFPSPALSHQDVLRTRYFVQPRVAAGTCPRCRAPLAADAPEGLCPACLLAGGSDGDSVPPTSSGHGNPAGAGAVDAAALAQAFPNLEIVELLGQGGMGTVYKVRQKNLDRLAALKVIPPQLALDPTFAERFSREARALARLNHVNIVTVYDQGQQGGFYFLLMEYIDGANLRQLMRSERIAPREALAIVPQICDALQYAHDQGIVHRDIKPENVLLDRTGRVKIADFGLAKLLGASPADFTLTHTQQVMGTPRYMAPEQIEHPLEVDHRADIYSLGVVIYEMLTGELPIGRFAPPSQKVEVDVRLDEIVLRTLEKEPQRRYQQVSEVKVDVESVTSRPNLGPAITAKRLGEATDTMDVHSKVKRAGNGLVVAGALSLAPAILVLFLFAMAVQFAWAEVFVQGAGEMIFSVATGLTFFAVPGAVLMIVAGLCLRRFRGYQLSRIAAIVAMLPLGISWLVTFPVGTWVLMVLLSPEVKRILGLAVREASSGKLAPPANGTPDVVTIDADSSPRHFSVESPAPLVRDPKATWPAATAKPGPSVGTILTIAGMILGFVMMGIGVGFLGTSVVALMSFPNQEEGCAYLFGWGMGVLLAGTIWFLRSWHKYRQLEEAVDLFYAPYVTWFDQVLGVCCVLGLIAAACGTVFGLQVFDLKETRNPFGIVEDIEVWSTLLVVGTVAAIQSGLALLWRQAAWRRDFAADEKTGTGPASGSDLTVRPGFLAAVVVPTLVIAAVWSLVLLDMHFMTSHWPRKSDHVMGMRPSTLAFKADSPVESPIPRMERAVVAATGDHRSAAIRSLWIAASTSVAIVFLGLALWRAVGPRQAAGGPQPALAVAPPFGHPIWPLAIVVIGFATFALPWVRLHLDAVAGDPDFKVQLLPGTDFYGGTLKQITRMPQGERYVALGYKNLGGAAAAIVCAAASVLAVGLALGRPEMTRVQGGLAVGSGVIAVVILLAFAHQLGERDESLIHDAITQRGLSRAMSGMDVGPGSGPALVVQEFVNVSPALGLYLAAAMAGFLILIGATQLAWLAEAPELANAASAGPLAPAAPAKFMPAGEREAIGQQVRGPGMGLIISGALGLLPVLLLCVGIPLIGAVLVPVRTGPMDLQTETVHNLGAATFAVPPVASVGIWQPPLILAQEMSPLSGPVPTWATMLGVLIVGLLVLLALPASILLILGGMKMRQLRSYGLAYLAAIVALLPLGPQWLVSLPMGIWALSVLGRKEVKGAFE